MEGFFTKKFMNIWKTSFFFSLSRIFILWSKSLLQIFEAYVMQSSRILGKNTAPSLKVYFKTPHFAPSEGAKYTSYFKILQKRFSSLS